MRYITVKEASEKWNISERRVCILCKNNRIPGAVKKSKVWMIPEDVKKPVDRRSTDIPCERNPLVFLYHPEYADDRENIELTEKEKQFCEMQKLFLSGRMEEAYLLLEDLQAGEKDVLFSSVLSVLKLNWSANLGKTEEYQSLLQKMLLNDKDRHTLLNFFWGSSDDLAMNLIFGESYEELMPLITMVSVKRGLNELVQHGISANITHFEILCNELEKRDNFLLSAYSHIFLAVYLHAVGADDRYDYHIRKALDYLLPRGWYVPIAEYSTTLDLRFVKDMDAKAYHKIEELSHDIVNNYLKVGIFTGQKNYMNRDKGINIQIGYKIVQGKTNEEIARELGISLYKVKQHIDVLGDVAGSNVRKDIKNFILKNFVL